MYEPIYKLMYSERFLNDMWIATNAHFNVEAEHGLTGGSSSAINDGWILLAGGPKLTRLDS